VLLGCCLGGTILSKVQIIIINNKANEAMPMLRTISLPVVPVDEAIVEEFFTAIKAGNEADAKALNDTHPELFNREYPYLHQALHAAVDGNQLEIARMLLLRGADANILNDHGDHITFYAVAHGHLEMLQLLEQNNADLFRQAAKTENTLLMVAVYHKKIEVLKWLLSKNLNVDVQNNAGKSAIHLAVSNNDVAAMRLLIDKYADINMVSESGDTPLHIAASRGLKEAAMLLISQGEIKLDIVNKAGKKIIDVVHPSLHSDLLPHLLRPEVKILIEKGDVENLQKLITEYADFIEVINQIDERPLLRKAMYKNDVGILKCLTLTGCNLSLPDESGSVLLIVASRMKKTAIFNYLLSIKVDINQPDREGVTALAHALKDNNYEYAAQLLQHGADTSTIQQDSGLHLLHLAAANGLIDLVKKLIEDKIDLNILSANGSTALMFAVAAGRVEIVKLLIESGANYRNCNLLAHLLTAHKHDSDNNNNKTVVEYMEIYNYLLTHCPDILQNEKGEIYSQFANFKLTDTDFHLGMLTAMNQLMRDRFLLTNLYLACQQNQNVSSKAALCTSLLQDKSSDGLFCKDLVKVITSNHSLMDSSTLRLLTLLAVNTPTSQRNSLCTQLGISLFQASLNAAQRPLYRAAAQMSSRLAMLMLCQAASSGDFSKELVESFKLMIIEKEGMVADVQGSPNKMLKRLIRHHLSTVKACIRDLAAFYKQLNGDKSLKPFEQNPLTTLQLLVLYIEKNQLKHEKREMLAAQAPKHDDDEEEDYRPVERSLRGSRAAKKVGEDRRRKNSRDEDRDEIPEQQVIAQTPAALTSQPLEAWLPPSKKHRFFGAGVAAEAAAAPVAVASITVVVPNFVSPRTPPAGNIPRVPSNGMIRLNFILSPVTPPVNRGESAAKKSRQ
jgi:ankyrin repeat protein